jgi:S1-C subfamily serine protease
MKVTVLHRLVRCFILVAMFLLVSCEQQKTPEQLFEERASGVVVILNEYYYELLLPNGNKVYFTGIDSDGDLENFTPDVEEIKKNPRIMTGTGFFIDDKGTIMTNRHVAQPLLDKAKAKAAYAELVKSAKAFIEQGLSQMQEKYADLQRQKEKSYVYDPYSGDAYYDLDRMTSIEQEKSEVEDSYNELNEVYENLNGLTDASAMKISVVSKIGIAYHDTYVTDEDDFLRNNACVISKLSSDENVDLALIQLKSKTTPSTSFVFDVLGERQEDSSVIEQVKGLFESKRNKDELIINQDLYMIGYNAGLVLGVTQQGIKVQLTSGKLTQTPDGQRLLYSIPTVQGSSGSPVIDAYGNFVGVNFAKLNGSDNFNFGIPAKKVVKFLNE